MNEEIGSVLVLILKCGIIPQNKNIKQLLWNFSDPFFIVQVCSVDKPDIPENSNLNEEDFLDKYYMKKALKYASEGPYIPNDEGIIESKKAWNNLPVIIIKDNSLTYLNNIDIKERIKISLDKGNETDIFFLCKWEELCKKEKITNLPYASQAIMYRPFSRDFIKQSLEKLDSSFLDLLNINILEGNLIASFFTPNIIEYDNSQIYVQPSTELVVSKPLDNYKTSDPPPQKKLDYNSYHTWIIIFISLIIIMVIMISKLSNNNKQTF